MRYVFGGFSLNVDRYELRRGDEPLEIQPKAFDVLRYLVANAERTVAKEELLDRVWPGVSVAESSLTQAVHQARRALGEQDGEGSIIATVRRRGYAMGVPVECVADDESADAPLTAERRLAALMSADVVSYTRHMARDDRATLRWLQATREDLTRRVEGHRGRVIDSPGDNLLAEFPSALDATECAAEVQRAFAASNAGLAPDARRDLRIGVHLGDVLAEEGRLYGDGVNVTARIERLAEPGGVAVSAPVHEQVRHRLDLAWTDLGEQRLKNVDHPVRVHHFHPSAAAAAAPAPPADKTRRTARLALAGALVLALLWLARPVELWIPESGIPGPFALAERTAIAVLPFADLSAGHNQAYLAAGIAEEVIHLLSRQPGLRVVARTSSFAFDEHDADVREIATQLGVGTVIGGSVRREEGRLRVTVQLIDAIDGFHIWSERYDRPADDVFAVQDEIASTLARKLSEQLGSATPPPRAKVYEPAPEAYDAYLQGRAEEGLRTPDSLERAVAQLERAVAIDPGYAVAQAELAHVHLMRIEFQGKGAYESAERAAARALELDPSLAEALAALAHLHRGKRDWEGAEALYVKALEQNPGWAEGWEQYGSYLAYLGRTQEALPAVLRGLDLDPLSPLLQRQAGRMYYLTGETDRAIAHLLRSIELNPDEQYAAALLWMAYEQKGMPTVAREALLRIAPGWTRPPARIVARLIGTAAVIRIALPVASWLSPPCTVRPTSAIYLYAYTGDADGVFACANYIIDQRSDLGYLKAHPVFDPYRADPRMVRVLARAGLE